MRDPANQKCIIQMANSKIKGTLRNHLDMYELGRGTYFNKKIYEVNNVDLDVRRGFKMTICSVNKELLLQVDMCTRVTRSNTMAYELEGKTSQSAQKEFFEATVITRYGKIRTYKVVEINYDLNPNSTFYSDEEVGQLSYLEYYKKKYGVKITNFKQPLIKVIRNYERKIVNGEL